MMDKTDAKGHCLCLQSGLLWMALFFIFLAAFQNSLLDNTTGTALPDSS